MKMKTQYTKYGVHNERCHKRKDYNTVCIYTKINRSLINNFMKAPKSLRKTTPKIGQEKFSKIRAKSNEIENLKIQAIYECKIWSF